MPKRPRKAKIKIAGALAEIDAPGFKKIIRGPNRPPDLYWVADENIPEYPTRTVRISVDLEKPDAKGEIERICNEQQAAMLVWQDGSRDDRERLKPRFDGTLGSLADMYEADEDSSLPTLKHKTAKGYREWLRLIRTTVGARRLDCIAAKDFRRWYREWASPKEDGQKPRVRRGYGGIQVVRVLMQYGKESNIQVCRTLLDDMTGMRFARNPPREITVTFEEAKAFVYEAIKRSKSNNEPERRREYFGLALAYALQFECFLRQTDVIGRWEPFDSAQSPHQGEIVVGKRIWRGMTMDMITLDDDLTIRTSKTGQPVVHALSACELVVYCLNSQSSWDTEGPVAARKDGLPWYDASQYGKAWREIAQAVGIRPEVQNRDARASGISEAAEAGARDDDIAKSAGHATRETTRRVYKRKGHQSSVRVQSQRQKFRKKNTGQISEEPEAGFPPEEDLDQ